MTGSTSTTGDFTGQSTYTLTLLYDPATNVSVGHSTETYTAALAGQGSGHVTFEESVKVNGDGSEIVTGVIVAGDGVFRGAHGLAVFSGTTDPTGANPSTGTYWMVVDLAR